MSGASEASRKCSKSDGEAWRSPIEPIDKSIYCSSVCKGEISEIELSGGSVKQMAWTGVRSGQNGVHRSRKDW